MLELLPNFSRTADAFRYFCVSGRTAEGSRPAALDLEEDTTWTPLLRERESISRWP